MKKAKVESFIVLKPGVTITQTGTLYDAVTDVINVPVGGMGAFIKTANSGNATAVNAAGAGVPELQFIQHRDKSNDPTPLYDKTLIQSPVIKKSCGVKTVGRLATVKQNSSKIIGAQTGTAGAVPVTDEAEYVVSTGLHGFKVDMFNGKNTPLKQGRFTTPDYFASTLYTVEVQKRDHLMQHLAFDFNSQSTQEVVAICIDSQAVAANGTGNVTTLAVANAITITAAAGLAVGDVVVIGFSDAGQAIKLTVDADLIQTFKSMLATNGGPLAGTELIIPYARPTAANIAATGRIVAGGEAAGVADANVDQMIFLALDMRKAAYEEVSQSKSTVKVGVGGAFEATLVADCTDPSEGSGYAKDVLLYLQNTAGHRQYLGNKPWQANHVAFPNEIVLGGIYDVYIIESCENRFASSGMPSVSPQKTIIAVLNTNVAGFSGHTGGANAQKADLEAILTAFVGSTVAAV